MQEKLKGGKNKMAEKIEDNFSEDDKVQTDMTFWNPKEDKEVIGLFKRWEEDAYGGHAVVQTAEKEELHLPNLTALNGRLKQGNVEEGNKIKVIPTGEKKSEKSGRMYQDFDIFIKKE